MSSDKEPDYLMEPADISERETVGARTLTIHSLLISTVMVLMLNSGGLVEMSRKLPFGPIRDTGEALAITWHARMDSYGLTDLKETVAQWAARFRERQWQSQADQRPAHDSPARLLQERIEQREV